MPSTECLRGEVSKGMEIGFKDLTYSVRCGFRGHKKEILHNISGTFPAGKLIGILGPSGAGKSTLLNLISGFQLGFKGEVTANGAPMNFDKFRGTSCYITQDDYLQGLLTVEENMKIAADLKLGQSVSEHEKVKLIEGILKTFGLYDERDVRSARLSGGQKKRLGVSLELLSNPTVLFLDEPTTGLDSFTSSNCLDYLKYLAGQGKTVICTIHQPSASQFRLFDVVYILANGRCLYQGESGQLVPFFESIGMPCNVYHNPADYVIECACGEYGQATIDTMVEAINNGRSLSWMDPKKDVKNNKTDLQKKLQMPLYKKRNKSEMFELKTLMRREYIKLKRNISFTYLRFISGIFISLVIGMAYFQLGKDGTKIWSNYNLVLVNTAAASLPALMLTMLEYPMQMPVLKKEHYNKYYSLKNYFISVTVLDLPISFAYAFSTSLIIYLFSGQPLELFRISMFSGMTFLMSIVAQSYGQFIGSSYELPLCIHVGVYTYIPIMLFSGFGMMFIDVPPHFYWITYLAYLRYGVMAMAGSIFAYARPKLPCPDDDYCLYSYGYRFLKDVGIDGERYGYYCFMMLLWYAIFRICSYVAMIRRMKN